MYCIRFLRSCFRGLLRFIRTWTTLFWRYLSNISSMSSWYVESDEDDECQYDSTWEDEDLTEKDRKHKKIYRSHRNICAARDMQAFRHRCPKFKDDDDDDRKLSKAKLPNLEFYRGQRASSPDNVYIHEFHEKWKGKYDRLEEVHSYIQWLFPLQEPGMNWSASELTENEIKLFRKDDEAKRKLVMSYELMLDFYGIKLVNKLTGDVVRGPIWEERFENLNSHSHNNLRITRILKCLGTLGLQHYQAPLVRFFLNETLVKDELPRVKQSVLDYFIFAVLNKSERQELVRFAYKHFKPQKDFVWGPKKILSQRITSDSKSEGLQNQNKAGSDQYRIKTNFSNNDDSRNGPRVDSTENIVSADQKKKKTSFEKMQTEENENNDTQRSSNEENVASNQTDEGTHSSQETNQKNGNLAQTADNDQSSPNSPNKLIPESISDQCLQESSQCLEKETKSKQFANNESDNLVETTDDKPVKSDEPVSSDDLTRKSIKSKQMENNESEGNSWDESQSDVSMTPENMSNVQKND